MSSDYLNYSENLAFPPQSVANDTIQANATACNQIQSTGYSADDGKMTVDKPAYESILRNSCNLIEENNRLRAALKKCRHHIVSTPILVQGDEQESKRRLELLNTVEDAIGEKTAAVIKVFNCGEAAIAKNNREFTLEKKLAIAVEGINSAAALLTCMDDLSEITGACNEQVALDELNKALEKMKESEAQQ